MLSYSENGTTDRTLTNTYKCLYIGRVKNPQTANRCNTFTSTVQCAAIYNCNVHAFT